MLQLSVRLAWIFLIRSGQNALLNRWLGLHTTSTRLGLGKHHGSA